MNGLTSLQIAPFDSRYLTHLIAYLQLKGWTKREYNLWTEFLGEEDAQGESLMLVLPRNANSPEAQNYMNKALDLLSALYDEPEITIAWRVQHFNSDVLIIRNTNTGVWSSIPIRIAEQQVTEVKHLVQLGARAEREPRPYFHNYSPGKKRILDQFRFGHTLPSSFALTFEATIIHSVELFENKNADPTQPPLLPELADYIVSEPIEFAPIERRIMERLVRGLAITNRAVNEASVNILVEEYGSGFNGNMCNALARLARDTEPIEYRVLWSPKLPVADDLLQRDSFRLNTTGYFLLEEAAEEMRRRPPEIRRIRGIVTHLGSDVPPLSDNNQGRQIIVRWLREETKRVVSLIVPLDRRQYMLASQAHLDWSYVMITGTVVRKGANYILLDARDMEVEK